MRKRWGLQANMAFVDLEKAFERIPRKVIWWALRKFGVEEWIVHPVNEDVYPCTEPCLCW